MALSRKLIHVEGIVDYSIMHELMTLLDGKSMNVTYRPVKHGGEDEETGELKAQPSGRQIVASILEARGSFRIKEAVVAAKKLGLTGAAVYAAANAMMNEGVLKRIAPGEYTTGKKAISLKPPGMGKHANLPSGKTVAATIADIVRSKQNGTGEGVSVKVIKAELVKAGAAVSGTSPAINSLLKKKLMKRVSPAHYRVEA